MTWFRMGGFLQRSLQTHSLGLVAVIEPEWRLRTWAYASTFLALETDWFALITLES